MNDPITTGDRQQRDLPRYSYLLRLWRASRSQAAGWRASLEEPRSGRKFGFANLEQLFAFIMQRSECDGTPPQAEHNAPADTPLGE